MKLNADATKISPKDQGLTSAKDDAGSARKARSESSPNASQAVRVSSPFLENSKRILDEVSAVDKSRVKEIREQIKSGQYNADPNRIAEGMLRESAMESVF